MPHCVPHSLNLLQKSLSPSMPRLLLAAGIVCSMTTAFEAAAGDRRFAYTYEATTHAKGEVEYEQWVTWKTHKDSDSEFDRFDFRHELEFGITDRLQLGVYVSDWRYQHGDSVADGADWRNVAFEFIYALTDPVEDSIGTALYGEFKIGDELLELEGKFIVQKNVGKWVLGYNGIVEAEWEGSHFDEDKGEFAQTFGASYQFSPTFLAGFELLHEVEYEDWESWGDHAVYAGPNFSYRAEGWWVTVAPLVQLTDLAGEANFQTRILIGIDF